MGSKPMPRETASAEARTISGTEWAIIPSVTAASRIVATDPASAPLLFSQLRHLLRGVYQPFFIDCKVAVEIAVGGA